MEKTVSKYAHCTPKLAKSQLSFRIDLARRRLGAYPLDDENFIYEDLERPETVNRMAHFCTGDLTGRMLEALTATNGIDGVSTLTFYVTPYLFDME